MIEIKAPQPLNFTEEQEDEGLIKIFLAGSIDMGSAIEWQSEVADNLSDFEDYVILLNPRRNDWDSTWTQSIENDQFREQVEWELEAMEQADVIFFCFDPNGKAPITLLELGLHVTDKRKPVVVVCPEGYWRKGNVDIVCKKYNNSLPYEDLDEGIQALRLLCYELE